jgi:guanylate kinase
MAERRLQSAFASSSPYNSPMPGTLYIVAAPSGAGKTSLTKALLEQEPGIALSVSYTSRLPRSNEVDGIHYHFVSRGVFEEMIRRGEFFEHAVVHGDLKGTSRVAVERTLAQGRDVLLEIDWQGARQVRAQMADTVSIFILPPSRAELERRLRARASDSEEVIRRRLADSRADIAHAEEFDYLLVNDDFAAALDELRSIVTSRQLRSAAQRERYATLLTDLLNE